MMMRCGLLLSWLVAGCAEKEAPADDTDAASDPDTAPEGEDSDEPEPEPAAPSIAAAFEPATVAAGESSELVVTIADFTVVDPTTNPPPEPTEGEGHFHVYFGETLVTAAWTPSLTIGTSSDDPAGDYVFTIVLVDSGHTELDPPVTAEATLTIE